MSAYSEKIKEITDILETGVKGVFETEKYQAYLKASSLFWTYSYHNQLLIFLQSKGLASQVAGFQTWKKLGRHVKKGEKAIKILCPMFFKHEKEETGEEFVITRFKAVNVFDIDQTEGKPLPSLCEKLTKNNADYDIYISKLVNFSPAKVEFSEIEGQASGFYDPGLNLIRVKISLANSHKLKTLVHEIAHSFFESALSQKEKGFNRLTAEVRAESVAFTVCNALGLDTSSYSFGYIAGWSSDKTAKELKETLKEIREKSAEILTAIMPEKPEKEACNE